MGGVADRSFTIRQTRKGFGLGGADEVVILGTGTDHGDGTATVTPADGLPFKPNADGERSAVVDLADLTDGHGHHGFVTVLDYHDG